MGNASGATGLLQAQEENFSPGKIPPFYWHVSGLPHSSFIICPLNGCWKRMSWFSLTNWVATLLRFVLVHWQSRSDNWPQQRETNQPMCEIIKGAMDGK